MATADHMTQAGTVRRESSHRTWFVAAIIVLLALAVVFGALWLLERDGVASLEGDLTTAEQTAQGLEGDLATTQSDLLAARTDIAALEAEVAALNAATPVLHEHQAEVQALYDDFRAAIQNPDAEEIASIVIPDIGAVTDNIGWLNNGINQAGEMISAADKALLSAISEFDDVVSNIF